MSEVKIDRRLIESLVKASVQKQKRILKECGCQDNKSLKEENDPISTPDAETEETTTDPSAPLYTLSPKERAKRQFERMTGKKWVG